MMFGGKVVDIGETLERRDGVDLIKTHIYIYISQMILKLKQKLRKAANKQATTHHELH